MPVFGKDGFNQDDWLRIIPDPVLKGLIHDQLMSALVFHLLAEKLDVDIEKVLTDLDQLAQEYLAYYPLDFLRVRWRNTFSETPLYIHEWKSETVSSILGGFLDQS
jgi:hypothetical protein